MWLAFAWASVSPLAILAQTASEENVQRFKMVMHLDEISKDGSFLLGAEYDINAFNQQNKGFCLLTNKGGKSTLQGVESVYPIAQVIEVVGEDCIWQLRKEGEEVEVYSPSVKMGVAPKKNSSSSLVLDANDCVRWKLDEVETGVFMLHSLQDETRALGLNWYGKYKIYFGLYKTTGSNPTRLRIYQKTTNSFDMPGHAVKPADGAHVAIYSGGQLLSLSGSAIGFEEATPYLLENGEVLPCSESVTWKCQYVGRDTFSLEDAEGSGLEKILEELSPDAEWKVENGYVLTNETLPRFLVCVEGGRLALMAKEDLVENKVFPVLLQPVADAPKSETSASGVRTLTGGWSAKQLSEMDWSNMTALDLTKLKLPLSAVEFVTRPEKSNAVVFVSADTKVTYISDWKNVVTSDTEGKNVWKQAAPVHDRNTWFIDRDVQLEGGLLTYQREAYADGNWETLILPFDAAVPANFEVGKFESYDGGDILYVEKTKDVVANEPMLVRYVGKVSSDRVQLVLKNKEGWLKPYIPSVTGPVGTYSPINVTSDNCGIYLLNAKGDTFVRATAGSYLAPFRVAFCPGETAKSVRVVFEDSGVTGVHTVNMDNGKHVVRTLDGRLVSPVSQSGTLSDLPKGVYIIDGKKYLK